LRVTLLPSAFPGSLAETNQYLTSYMINDTLAIDAGSLGLFGGHAEQARVRHVLISHSHADHVATLPVFVENAYEAKPESVEVHGSAAVLDSLRRDVFNGRVWPNFEKLAPNGNPFLRLSELESGRAIELEGLRITPVEVNHAVPTLGFIIEDDHSAVVIPSDTAPTEEIWARANRVANLSAIFLEASFPEWLAQVADAAKHLTPKLFAAEVRKLTRPVRLIAVHIKPRFREQILAELSTLGLPNLEVVRPGQEYNF
jgi:ribonuclease BN (tRNA processing enzyme)